MKDEPGRNPFDSLDCGELLRTLDFVTLSYIQGTREPPRITSTFIEDKGRLNSIDRPSGRHWLWLCSRKPGPEGWIPAMVQLREHGFVVPVTAGGDGDARVHFPRELCGDATDLNHCEIGDMFNRLGSAAEIAREMLARVRGKFLNSFQVHDGFIDAVIVLLFGVQASRNWANCATSLMLLELIAGKHCAASQGASLFTLAGAFQEGGKRSTADVHRDLGIVRHWLDMTEPLGEYNQLSVKGRILKLLRTYLG